MKILVVLSKDGPNLFCESIIRKLYERHELRLFAVFDDSNSLRMFTDLNAHIRNIKELSHADEEWADCVFCPIQSLSFVQSIRKYVFSFCNMNPKFDDVRGVDFVFMLSDIEEPSVPYFASMPVGLPKNDAPDLADSAKHNQFLYVDSGHYPFGKQGHRQIAQMLLDICHAYPDHKIVVKPRWFPDAAASAMTHINFDHLYNTLDDICPQGLPGNLELLREHKNLQALIDDSDCVLTLCSTTYLDVAMRGKPQLIIDGLDNEDMYQVRASYFDSIYEFAKGSGCVVDYRDVLSHLPDGLMCRPEHIQSVFTYKQGATDRVVDVMEYIGEHLLPERQYPAIGAYRYETYKEQLESSARLSMSELLINRVFCLSLGSLALCASISRNIDWKPFYLQQYELCKRYMEKCGNTRGMVTAGIISACRRDVGYLKCRYLIEHPDFVQNDVDESYLYYAMFQLTMYEDLLRLYNCQGDNPHDALAYYAAQIYYRLGEYGKAIKCFERYLDGYWSRDYPRYITEKLSLCVNAYKQLMLCRLKTGKLHRLAGTASQMMKFIKRNKIKYGTALSMQLEKTKPKMVARLRRFWYDAGRIAKIYDDTDRAVLAYADTHKGESCFIIGDGPGVNTHDLERIKTKGYTCLASDSVHKLFDRTDWRPDYYACVEPGVFIQNMSDILTQIECPVFLQKGFKPYVDSIKKSLAKRPKNVKYIRYIFSNKREAFYPVATPIVSGGTVTVVLMELAWMMGFRKIYLIGCDDEKGFNKNEVGSEGLISAFGGDGGDSNSTNDIDQAVAEQITDLDNTARIFRNAREYIEKHGGEVYSATRGGKSEVFERVDLDELLK